MKIHDITRPMYEGMAVYPGDPTVRFRRGEKVEEGASANTSVYTFGSHTGTHVDPPFHLLTEGAKLDELALEQLIGPALVVECPAGELGAELVGGMDFCGAARLLIKTSAAPDSGIFAGSYLTGEAAAVLVERGVKLVGVEALSVDKFGWELDAHRALLASGAVIIEGLDLSGVAPGTYELICLPMKVQGGDGAPARVVLLERG
ncbi:MAG: cyclase family protein [Nitrospirae bacterium]|nr:cyclase family protein [Nitrospirota bacterium]